MASNPASDWRILEARDDGGVQHFAVRARALRRRCDVRLTFPGIHNAQNACAALILAEYAGVDLDVAVAACADFRGPARRFEILGERDGVTVVDDYAHHPTEVGAAIDAARQRYPGRRLIAIHTPHTYSRVSRLLEDYRQSFTGADVVIIGPIEEARERGMPKTVSSEDVAARAGPGADVHVVGVERRGDRPAGAASRARATCCSSSPSAASTSWRRGCSARWRFRVSAGEWLDTYPGVRADEPLARHSQFGVGGPAQWFTTTRDAAVACATLLRRCTTSGVAVTMLGAGSNALISDAGIRGLVDPPRRPDAARRSNDARVELGGGCDDAARGARLRERAASRVSSSASACRARAAPACTAMPAHSGPRWSTCSSTAPRSTPTGRAVTLDVAECGFGLPRLAV